MKRFIYFASMVLGMSLLLDSCSGNGWMEGYWVNEDSSQYLFVKGDEVYTAYPTSKRKKTLDFDGAKELFEKQAIEPWNTFEIGKAIGVGDEGIYFSESIGVKDIKRIKKIDEYVDESIWEKIIEALPSNDYKFLCAVQCGVDEDLIFCSSKEKNLAHVSVDLEYGDKGLELYSKIKKTGKEKKLTPEEKQLKSWGELFDENDVVVFDTGLVGHYPGTKYFYLFLHSSKSSDNKTEGKAKMCEYLIDSKPSNRGRLFEIARYDYALKNGMLYLTHGEVVYLGTEIKHRLDIDEMSMKYHEDNHTLEGVIWINNRDNYDITATPIDFDYTYWKRDLYY